MRQAVVPVAPAEVCGTFAARLVEEVHAVLSAPSDAALRGFVAAVPGPVPEPHGLVGVEPAPVLALGHVLAEPVPVPELELVPVPEPVPELVLEPVPVPVLVPLPEP